MKRDNYLYQLKDVYFSYQLGSVKMEALRGISLTIPKYELVTLSGPSGSGKSTLLNVLGLIEDSQSGQVLFLNEDLSTINEKQKNHIRKYQIGFIFQQFHLIPVFTAEENIAYFLARQGLFKNEIKQRVQEALEAVGLWEHRMKKPGELSGGQRQRVAIARAIAKKPEVIIGDEPTANLDQKTGREIMDIFHHLVEKKQASIILTTHDAMVQSFASCNFQIKDGALSSI
ncbi:ABC transporter ATP-binding protein [Candidatus Protochlamydia phocaeensis]|uniref:ABC transporter ATP-binding protein n=1 Tax=Candidatus Protochlamydia phocaeensis TaxID=1414722 RepID=UPI000838D367|nr:ABC transporter ATP-binding protein [Candidatus Protochlamydia phocaeensis]